MTQEKPSERRMADAPGVVRSCRHCQEQIYVVRHAANLVAVDALPRQTFEVGEAHQTIGLVVSYVPHELTCVARARAKAEAELAARQNAAAKPSAPAAAAANSAPPSTQQRPAATPPATNQRPRGGQHMSQSAQSPHPIRKPQK